MRAGKKVQLALIGSTPRAVQRAIDEPCTLPVSPPRVAQNVILMFFASKIELVLKSATTFLYVKTSSSKVVATSFLYLMVHR